jgi:hypothetical protein
LPAIDGTAVIPPKLLDFQPAFEAVLPPEWVLIGRCRAGEARGAAGGGCFVLAHAEIGVALVDLLPMRTPQAEAQLRRLLNAVDFSAQCRGYLPIIQCEITPDEFGGLRARIEEAFAYDSVLTIADRGRWVGVLRRTLQAGVTWEALDGPLPEPRRARLTPPVARVMRAGLLGCGVLGIFGLGFVTALLLPAEPVAALPGSTPGFGVVASAAPALTTPTLATPLAPDPPPVALPVVENSPAVAELSVPAAATPDSRTAELAEPAAAPPEAHPLSVAASARRPTRLPLPIDRRCSEAVFRFQQGASLSAQEMAHVRQGCASMR